MFQKVQKSKSQKFVMVWRSIGADGMRDLYMCESTIDAESR